jgi:hypothetical protein
MTRSSERMVRIESIRIPHLRDSLGSCVELRNSINADGLHRPVTLWSDGTLVSGSRRLRAHLLDDRKRIPAVFVDTVEEAAKRMLDDNLDDYLALPWKWSEVCRWWQRMRLLDAPAAAERADEARRRGVELRKQTRSGERPPGRTTSRSEDYVLTVLAEPFRISAATARRLEIVYLTSTGAIEAPGDKRALAASLMNLVDSDGNVWGAYKTLRGDRAVPLRAPKPVVVAEPAAAPRQVAAWGKSLPQMEGLVAGLIELGPPNTELTWEQVGPVFTRLSAIRRELEKIIKRMKEINPS